MLQALYGADATCGDTNGDKTNVAVSYCSWFGTAYNPSNVNATLSGVEVGTSEAAQRCCS
jgi:hypothetical protein